MSHSKQHLTAVRSALQGLAAPDLRSAGAALLSILGYASPKTLETGGDPGGLLEAVGIDRARFEKSGGVGRWRAIDLIFQLTGEELPALTRGSRPSTADDYRRGDIDSFVFLALDLDDQAWSRRQLVEITRGLNTGFDMPAIVVFRHAGHATIAVIDRRKNLRDASRSVVGGRVSLIKDVDLVYPHRAHVEIVADMTLSALRPAPTDFRSLYDAWLKVLSATELNKRFYGQLADWFAWASSEGIVHFPPGQGNNRDERAVGLIRLLTRLMFVWFIKQKDLAPGALFERDPLRELLQEPPDANPDGHDYYLAVLQNLFFACLNTEMGGRGWLERKSGAASADYFDHTKLRHRGLFADPGKAKAAFDSVPFLNGGLFDCLDVEIESSDHRADRAGREVRKRDGRDYVALRVDGFSETEKHQPRLPNRLFFDGQKNADLSEFYGRTTRRDVLGLIDLFDHYKFTVEENTPLEEEAALDPELLGKVFENLLASYNEDTKTTARNKSGSFYTPREVVDFMVDEALVAYLGPVLAPPSSVTLRPRAPSFDFDPGADELALDRPPQTSPATGEPTEDPRLRAMLSYDADPPSFTAGEANALVKAIEECRAIDPAVGSGAFPLGLLQKLVHLLNRLDPSGDMWKVRNREPLERDLESARRTPSPADRADRIAAAEARLKAFDESFDTGVADYARKLYLIEGCLHGVDIQPIAVQIAKLRCFIALAVEQAVDNARPNRGITPLPNLELKFVAANALGLINAGQGQLRGQDVVALERERRRVNAEFFSARSRREKQAARERILQLRKDLTEALKAGGFPAEDAQELADWDPFDANAAAPFFDPEWMFGLGDHTGGCFDIAFANPPYVRHEKVERDLKAKLRSTYATFTGTADLYVYFYERSVGLLKPGSGILAFITSNKWYRAAYGGNLRKWLTAEARLLAVIDFGDAEVFEAIAYPTILIARRRARRARNGGSDMFRALTWDFGRPSEGFPAVFATEAFDMPQAELQTASWQLEPSAKRNLIAQLRTAGAPLNTIAKGRVARGITTGFNDAYVINGERRQRLIDKQPECAAIIKPFLGGRNIMRWGIDRPDLWLIKLPSSENVAHAWTGLPEGGAEKVFRSTFPAIFDWWTEEGWIESLKRRYDQGHFYWELRSCTYWAAFDRPKIVSTKITMQPTFAIDTDGYYLSNTAYFFDVPDELAVCAILNSSVSAYLARQIFVQKQGGFYEVQPSALEMLPIPSMSPEQAHLVSIVVRAIRAGTPRQASWEALINGFAYELFLREELAGAGLSPFRAAREANLEVLGSADDAQLLQRAEEWSRVLSDPSSPLSATLFAVQSIGAVRIIEGRA